MCIRDIYFVVWERWQVFAFLGPAAGMSLCTVPIVIQLVTSTLKPNEQGIALGTMAAIKGLASAVGPILGAAAYSLGSNQLGFSALPYSLSLTVSIIGLLVTLFVVRPLIKELERSPTTLDNNNDLDTGEVNVQSDADRTRLLATPVEARGV
eukprot:TRINITY_DN10712_c0_g1_i1.p1 TRINITY_DN10712_c0_g1~~TRINITY_DN10712_c0_g1_i1.p1  ORF type:complete len:152 (+),score=21.32 TRINITY_DN10712_c0_g1_i1:101-556(+)